MKAATVTDFTPGTGAYISIHAAREGGDPLGTGTLSLYEISIHAAREGGDTVRVARAFQAVHFNPRRP